jgi:hypothetical protein
VSESLAAVRDAVIIVSGLFGLLFGLYRSWRIREIAAVLQIEIEPEVHSFHSYHLVDLRIMVRNVGKASVRITSADLAKSLCIVRRVAREQNGGHLRWEDTGNVPLIGAVPYLQTGDSKAPKVPLTFEPNATEALHVVFYTEYSGPVWARSEIFDRHNTRWWAERLFVLPDLSTKEPHGAPNDASPEPASDQRA